MASGTFLLYQVITYSERRSLFLQRLPEGFALFSLLFSLIMHEGFYATLLVIPTDMPQRVSEAAQKQLFPLALLKVHARSIFDVKLYGAD